MTTTESELWATAYHEAGHAVVALRLGIGIGRKGVTIIPDPSRNSAGSAHVRRGFTGRPDMGQFTDRMFLGAQRNVIASFAGPAAQRKFRPTSVRRWQASGDRQDILNQLSYFVSEIRELEALCKWLSIRAENLVNNRVFWIQICAVAEALVVNGGGLNDQNQGSAIEGLAKP